MVQEMMQWTTERQRVLAEPAGLGAADGVSAGLVPATAAARDDSEPSGSVGRRGGELAGELA